MGLVDWMNAQVRIYSAMRKAINYSEAYACQLGVLLETRREDDSGWAKRIELRNARSKACAKAKSKIESMSCLGGLYAFILGSHDSYADDLYYSV